VIYTLTLNPALDKTAELAELKVGALNRLENVRQDPGGKGINVSKVLAELGCPSTIGGFLGTGVGSVIKQALNRFDTDFVEVSSPSRTNLKIVQPGGTLTELNEPGLSVDPQDVEQLLGKLAEYSGPDAVVVLSGSLAQGVPTDFYVSAARIVHGAGGRVLLDADGPAFAQALAEHPDFAKPNWYELALYLGIDGPAPEPEQIAEYAEELGVPNAAVSLGGDGAVFVAENQAWAAEALHVPVRSTVGAGDSMVAAFAYALDKHLDFPEAAVLAMACSAAAVTTEGTSAPQAKTIEELKPKVKLRRIK
jgi:1-phosphofructokinase